MLQAKDLGANFTVVKDLLASGSLLYPYPSPAFLSAANSLFDGATTQSLASAAGSCSLC